MTTTCSPQSIRGGLKNKLPWLLYNLSAHLRSPVKCESFRRGSCGVDYERTEERYGHVVGARIEYGSVGIVGALEKIKDGNKKHKEWACDVGC